MVSPRFSDIGACVFDLYGTLVDVNAAVNRHRERIGPKADALAELWRRKQLEYSWLRTLMGRHADFWRVTAEALDHALDVSGISDATLRADLMELYRTLDAYPEVAPTLANLRKAGMPCAVLSNGAPGMLASAIASAGIGPQLDAVLSVEAVGLYKPHPRVYRLAVDELGVPAHRIAFMSANGWDIAGGASFGFATVWINRAGLSEERLPFGPAATLGSLGGLPALLGL
jgi:2-haloacid dehalogenase